MPIFWHPAASPSIIRLAIIPAPDRHATTLRQISASASAIIDDLRHVLVGRFEQAHRLVVAANVEADAPLTLALPLDADTPARLRAAGQFWRQLSNRNEFPPDMLTPLKRTRLTQCLRALDGKLSGATTRDIAAVLFDADKLELGRDWRSHDLRSRTRRLIDEGMWLMRGGYADLLHPPPADR